MPVAKLLGASSPDLMKAEEGTDPLDTFLRQAVGREPVFSFARTGENPVQWIQLLHALDQQEIPGWPLLAPVKVQMQKCDKCSREFCSTINYRRHIRLHRRSLIFHKEPQKYRDLLAAFWDKLSCGEAKEIISFKDVNLEEVPGSSIVRSITANLRKPGFLSLPQAYVKAGNALVDIIQGRPSRIPISSQELFSILDDASERTFLCAGTAESLQKYVFDGEASKIGLEMKNLIACACFLVEQRLLKAWLADKDAEALRCQKLLVEEEEAAQRRRAELLERKRQRKLRQKEHKARDQLNDAKVDLYAASDVFESTPSSETCSPPTSTEVDSRIPDDQVLTPLEPSEFTNNEEDIDIEAQGGCSSDHSDNTTSQNTEYQKVQGNSLHHFVARWQVPKSQKGGRNGFHGNQNVNTLKREQAHKHGPSREQRTVPVNGSKVWTKKPKSENVGVELVKSRVQNDAVNQTDQSNCQLMIGSISVTVRNSPGQHQNSRGEFQENGNAELKKNSIQSGTSRPAAKFWRPRHDIRDQVSYRSRSLVSDEDVASEKGTDQTQPAENSSQSCNANGHDREGMNDSHPQAEDNAKPDGMPFSIDEAKAFLTQRWKEATAGDHVKLVLSAAHEPPGRPDAQKDHQVSESQECNILVTSENRQGKGGVLEYSTVGNVKPKFRTKPEKGVKTKYIPKQRAVN